MKGNVKIPHILLSCLTGFATSNERSSKKTQITNNVYKLWKKLHAVKLRKQATQLHF